MYNLFINGFYITNGKKEILEDIKKNFIKRFPNTKIKITKDGK